MLDLAAQSYRNIAYKCVLDVPRYRDQGFANAISLHLFFSKCMINHFPMKYLRYIYIYYLNTISLFQLR